MPIDDPDIYLLLKDWQIMDTRYAETLTDEQLLKQMEFARILGGWGLIAELMKRYARLRGLLDGPGA